MNRVEPSIPPATVHAGSPRWRLREADSTVRLFITMFLLLLTSGYAIGLLFVEHTTTGSQQGMVEEYRGTPEQEGAAETAELKFAKSANEMYILLHNHILSLAMIFFAVGGIFYFTGVSAGIKKFLMVEPFLAVATTFGGIWLIRFVSEHFSWLVLISGVSMVACYGIMVALIFKELWFKRP